MTATAARGSARGRTAPRRPRTPRTAVAAAVAGLVLTLTACSPDVPAPTTPATTSEEGSVPEETDRTPTEAGEAFLDTYVDPDGRVVRHDQGGDTVSEGQAYGLLVAVGVDDPERFARVWDWTRENLQRPDGLLSWRWADGAVVDPQPASDADLDAARALALAAERFDEPAYAEAATVLGRAVLDLETASTARGLVLLAGPWADVDPYQVNPSYPTPVATRLLAELDDDPRWSELDEGTRSVTEALTADGTLPPNWAQVHGDDGRVEAMPGPDGRDVMFGYDAARTLVRYAESCEPADRAAVAGTAGTLELSDGLAAELDLGGAPLTQDQHPLTYVSRAAVRALDGDLPGARADLRSADAVLEQNPTYFGAAWAALGRLSLETDLLGGCPLLAEDDAASDSDSTSDSSSPSGSGTTSSDGSLPGSDPASTPTADGRLTLQPRTDGVASGPQPIPAAGVVPLQVRIPEIGVTSTLENLVRDSERVLQDPAVPEVAGWYSEGTVPGSVGPSIIAGHVDSGVAGAIFRDLDQLVPGSEVLVDLSDGTTATFRVSHAEVVPQAQFPTDVVYGPVPDAQLRLITCHGYDRDQRRYVENLVVFATLVA